jgi:hypothetical protein
LDDRVWRERVVVAVAAERSEPSLLNRLASAF